MLLQEALLGVSQCHYSEFQTLLCRTLSQCIIIMSLSLFHMIFNCHVYAILSLFFYFQFAVAILTNIGFVCFIAISDFACHHFNAMLPVEIYHNRASYNTLMKLSDYFLVDHVAHSKFNASNTPKEKIALCQVKGMRWVINLCFGH